MRAGGIRLRWHHFDYSTSDARGAHSDVLLPSAQKDSNAERPKLFHC